jgi:hypothetical protein
VVVVAIKGTLTPTLDRSHLSSSNVFHSSHGVYNTPPVYCGFSVVTGQRIPASADLSTL